MRSILSTGGTRDYVELIPETVSECADLVRIAQSKFIEEDRLFLNLSNMGGKPMTLVIYVSLARPHPNAAMNDAQDATP
jgi:hypothetical protein